MSDRDLRDRIKELEAELLTFKQLLLEATGESKVINCLMRLEARDPHCVRITDLRTGRQVRVPNGGVFEVPTIGVYHPMDPIWLGDRDYDKNMGSNEDRWRGMNYDPRKPYKNHGGF